MPHSNDGAATQIGFGRIEPIAQMTHRPRAYRPRLTFTKGWAVVGAKWWMMCCLAAPALSHAQSDCPDAVDVLQPITCSGADDGVLSVAIPDGVESGEIYWLQNNDTLFGATQSDLGPGSYLVFIPGCPPLGATLNEPFTFFISAAITRLPTCDDPCSGEITVTPNFGQGNITYSWSHDAAETGPVGDNVCEQVILVSAMDENGCSDDDIIVVEIPDVEVLTFATDPSCFGFSDGAVAAVATGGLGGGFEFEWEDADGEVVGSQADVNGLPAGGYLVTATDTGGCAQTEAVFLQSPPPVDVDMSATGVSCFGDADGTATAYFDNAVSYAWTGPDGFTTTGPDADSLALLLPGTYDVQVTASDGCVGAGSIEVTAPDPLSAEPFLSSPSCPGLSDGTVGVVAEGGTPEYSVEWTLADGSVSEGTFLNGVTAGTFAYALEDANGCAASGTVTLEDPEPLSASVSIEMPLCAEGPLSETGSVEATVNGGLSPYSAVWVDAASAQVVATGLSAANLVSGAYGLGVMDMLGCILDTIVVLESPGPLLLDVAVTPPLCAGENNGSAAAAVTGGTPGYTFVWSGGAAPSLGPDLDGMAPGLYAVEVTDENGCQASEDVVVEEPAPLELELSADPVGCNGADGVASGSVVGGTAPYAWSWTDENGDLVSATDSATGLVPGTYTAVVLDDLGCLATASVTVGALPPLEVDLSVGPVDCATGEAAVNATVTGGAAPVEWTLLWDGTPLEFEPGALLSAGAYALVATDDRGCTADTTWVLHPPILATTSVVPFGCEGGGVIQLEYSGGDSTGQITVDAGILGAPTTSNANGATWESVPEGQYSIDIEDGTCSVIVEVEMTGVSLFEWNVDVLPFACDEAAGGVTVSIDGGTLPLEATGSSSDGLTTWSSLDTLGLTPGTYVLSVTDGAGCMRDTVLEVDLVPALELTASASSVQCSGGQDGSIVAEAGGGTAPLTLGAVGESGPLEAPLENLAPGTYTVGVIDARGCTADTLVEVLSPAPLEVTTEVQPESCTGVSDGTVQAIVSGGTAPLSVQWTGGPDTDTWTGLTAGEYTWTAVDFYGCDTTGTLEVVTEGGLTAVAEVLPVFCDEGAVSGAVSIVITGNVEALEVALGGLPADEVADSTTSGVWTWYNLAAGTYGWSASLGEGCSSQGQVEVVLPLPLVFQASVVQPLCEGGTGSIEVNPNGGESPWDVVWQGTTLNGDSVQGMGVGPADLEEGQYTWSLVDAAGCSRDTTVQLAALSSGLSLDQDLVQPTCGGALVGEATLTLFGGLPPYALVVQGAADSTFLPFLIPGSYPLTLTDSVGCTFLDTVYIEPASDFELFAEVDPASCANSEDGQVVLTTENGTGAVDFTFSGPFGAVAVGDTVSDVGAGVYEVTALDSAGCPAVLLVDVPAPPPVVVVLDSLARPSCAGDEDGHLSVSVNGGAGMPYLVNWTLDGMPWAEGPVQASIGEGLYAVEAVDAQGCTGGIEAIPVLAQGDVSLTVPSDTALCAGTPLELEALSTGATEAYWSVQNGANGLGLSAFSNGILEGDHYWSFTATRLGCVQEDSVLVTGFVLPTPEAGQDALIVSGAASNLGAGGAEESWTYAWSPGTEVAFEESPSTPTNPLFESTTFILQATTLEGCVGTDTVLVEVLQTLDIPSGFTPNDDGTNDFWNLNGLEQYPSAEITVFNRWGDVLFTQGANDGAWDGKVNGILVPVGTYYYHIRVNEPALQTEWTGPITIMR